MADGGDTHACDHDGVRPRSRRLRRDCATADARSDFGTADARSDLRTRGTRSLPGLFTGEPRRGCARDASGERQQGHPRDACQTISRQSEVARSASYSAVSLITSATLLSFGSTITICCAVRKNRWLFTCGTFWPTSLGMGRGVMPCGTASPTSALASAASAFMSLANSRMVWRCSSVRLSFDVGASTSWGCCGATCAGAPAHDSINAMAAVIALCIACSRVAHRRYVISHPVKVNSFPVE